MAYMANMKVPNFIPPEVNVDKATKVLTNFKECVVIGFGLEAKEPGEVVIGNHETSFRLRKNGDIFLNDTKVESNEKFSELFKQFIMDIMNNKFRDESRLMSLEQRITQLEQKLSEYEKR